jgi:hypothetical protein
MCFRFGSFGEKPLIFFGAFDYRSWPQGRSELEVYGGDEVQGLVDHFDSVLTLQDTKSMAGQFTALTVRIGASLRQRPLLEVYGPLLASRPPALVSVLKPVDIMFTLSPSTATCEKSFSHIKLVKSNQRTSLKQDIVQDYMQIILHGPHPGGLPGGGGYRPLDVLWEGGSPY